MSMNESHILALENIVKEINLSDDSAYDNLYNLFTNNHIMPIITAPIKKENFCFRSRTNLMGKDFTKFEEITYPHKKYVNSYSRVNKPNQQIFYCSDSTDTTITELMPSWVKDIKEGENFHITTSKWKFLNEILVTCPH